MSELVSVGEIQSRMGSLVESIVNVIIGGAINFVANLTILPLIGFSTLSLSSNLMITLIFTAISVIRSYTLRRWFNGRFQSFLKRTLP